jgi:hypothetical protein
MIKIDNKNWETGDLLALMALVKLEADKAIINENEKLMLKWARIYKSLDDAEED